MPLRGAVEVKRALKNVPQQARRELIRGLVQIGQTEVEGPAKERLTALGHVITGNLRGSIRTRVVAERGVVKAVVGTDVVYALPVEKLPDGGYLRWALLAHAGQIERKTAALLSRLGA